jgi:hypothetical protein
MESGIGSADTDGRRTVSKTVSLVTAVALGAASLVLVALDLLTTALTCGDDGPLDDGTASAAVRHYCRISFHEHRDGSAHLSAAFTTLALLGVIAVAVAVVSLATTRRRNWLHASLAVLGLLTAWTFAILVGASQ